jgi:hypothetical protein
VDEVELFLLGAAFAVILFLIEVRFRSNWSRAALDLSLLLVTGLALYGLRLNILNDVTDFIDVDLGAVLVVGAFGVGGLLPYSLLDS